MAYIYQSWDKHKFIEYLVNECSLSRRAAGDYASRCKRVEMVLSIDLIEYTSGPDIYKKLLNKINNYSYEVSTSDKSRYALSGTMRLAVKKFAEFNNGSKFTCKINGHNLKR